MKTKTVLDQTSKVMGASLASSVLAAAMMSVSSAASAGDTERCADIVKGGKNSCAVKSLGISCQGNATEDNMKGAWIKVPAGTCGNIVNICAGVDEAPASADAGRIEKACDKIAEQDATVAGGRLVDKFGEAI